MPGGDQAQGATGQRWAHRATSTGGYWENVRDETGRRTVHDEIWAYITCGSEYESNMRAEEILHKLELAEAGALTHREKGQRTGGDVAPLWRTKSLFELIWDKPRPFEKEERPVLFRLYFAEPTEVDELMLGLHFAKKRVRPRRDTGRMQNEDIDKASARYAAWKRT